MSWQLHQLLDFSLLSLLIGVFLPLSHRVKASAFFLDQIVPLTKVQIILVKLSFGFLQEDKLGSGSLSVQAEDILKNLLPPVHPRMDSQSYCYHPHFHRSLYFDKNINFMDRELVSLNQLSYLINQVAVSSVIFG